MDWNWIEKSLRKMKMNLLSANGMPALLFDVDDYSQATRETLVFFSKHASSKKRWVPIGWHEDAMGSELHKQILKESLQRGRNQGEPEKICDDTYPRFHRSENNIDGYTYINIVQ